MSYFTNCLFYHIYAIIHQVLYEKTILIEAMSQLHKFVKYVHKCGSIADTMFPMQVLTKCTK